MRIVLRASEVSKIVFNQKPPFAFGNKEYSSIELMSTGRFIESYLINQVGNIVGLKINFIRNRENVIKKILEVGDIDVYLKGRADGRAYGSYMIQDKLLRYDYIVEVKHLITQTIDSKETIIKYYKPQIISYNILYNLPVIFYAVLKDGFIFDIFYYNKVEIENFNKAILEYVMSKLIKVKR